MPWSFDPFPVTGALAAQTVMQNLVHFPRGRIDGAAIADAMLQPCRPRRVPGSGAPLALWVPGKHLLTTYPSIAAGANGIVAALFTLRGRE
jgi:hypothetical protein